MLYTSIPVAGTQAPHRLSPPCGRRMKLTQRLVSSLTEMRQHFADEAVANIALVLAGVRPAYRYDVGPRWFTEDGDMKDKAYRSRVSEAYSKDNYIFIEFVHKHFKSRLGIIDQFEPVVYMVGAVLPSDIRAISQNDDVKAYARALNFTGTAYPCSRRRDTVMISWLCVDGQGATLNLSNHCAKPAEVYACIREFAAMKARAKDVIGLSFGGFTIADLKMSLNRQTDVLIA